MFESACADDGKPGQQIVCRPIWDCKIKWYDTRVTRLHEEEEEYFAQKGPSRWSPFRLNHRTLNAIKVAYTIDIGRMARAELAAGAVKMTGLLTAPETIQEMWSVPTKI